MWTCTTVALLVFACMCVVLVRTQTRFIVLGRKLNFYCREKITRKAGHKTNESEVACFMFLGWIFLDGQTKTKKMPQHTALLTGQATVHHRLKLSFRPNYCWLLLLVVRRTICSRQNRTSKAGSMLACQRAWCSSSSSRKLIADRNSSAFDDFQGAARGNTWRREVKGHFGNFHLQNGSSSNVIGIRSRVT